MKPEWNEGRRVRLRERNGRGGKSEDAPKVQSDERSFDREELSWLGLRILGGHGLSQTTPKEDDG